MKATGIVRRMDELGRVVIPKEIRRSLRIKEGDPLEIFTDQMNGCSMVCFRKQEAGFMNSLTRLADAIDDEMMDESSWIHAISTLSPTVVITGLPLSNTLF